MRFESCEDFFNWMDSFIPAQDGRPGLVRDARLERMGLLLSRLGNPEEAFKSIHVAGSKGKGSTSRFLSAILSAAGEETGLYLSPHLVDHRERFTLDGKAFDDDLMLECAEALSGIVADLTLPASLGPSFPTTFELYTAFAYLLFAAHGCTWAVIETGLGGRLDATNTLESAAAVITPIELEHTKILGDTIEKIAIEKSKIIKSSGPAFTGFLRPEAQGIMMREAYDKGVPLYSLARECVCLETETRLDGEHCHIAFEDGYDKQLVLAMRGGVQVQNAALALLVSRHLGFHHDGLSEAALSKATLPGRFEHHVYKGRDLIIDVSHTPLSLSHTVSSFNALYKDRKTACVFSCIEGKDVERMLEVLLPAFPRVVISRPSSFKKSDSAATYSLARRLNTHGAELSHQPGARDALDAAVKDADAILVAGSFYLASLIEEVLDAEQQ